MYMDIITSSVAQRKKKEIEHSGMQIYAREFIALGRLYDVVEDENVSILSRLKYKHILILRLFMV